MATRKKTNYRKVNVPEELTNSIKQNARQTLIKRTAQERIAQQREEDERKRQEIDRMLRSPTTADGRQKGLETSAYWQSRNNTNKVNAVREFNQQQTQDSLRRGTIWQGVPMTRKQITGEQPTWVKTETPTYKSPVQAEDISGAYEDYLKRRSGESTQKTEPITFGKKALDDAGKEKLQSGFSDYLRDLGKAKEQKEEQKEKQRKAALPEVNVDKYRESASEENKNIKNGLFDRSKTPKHMSIAGLTQQKAELEQKSQDWQASLPKTAEERKGLQLEAEDLSSRPYMKLANEGLQDPLTGKWYTAKPEDYDDYDDRTGSPKNIYYDSLIYDAIHGENAWHRDFMEGTDEQSEWVDAEVEDLWNRLASGTLMELDAQRKEQNAGRIDELTDKITGKDPYAGQLKETENELQSKQRIQDFEKNATGSGEYVPQEIEMRMSSTGDPYYYVVGGDDLDMSVYYANHPYDQMVAEMTNGTMKNAQPHWTQARDEYFMTPEQVETLNQYYNQGTPEGRESAKAYLEALKPYLQELKIQYQEEDQRARASGPLGALEGIATIPVQVAAGAVGLGGSIAALFGNEEAANPNSDLYSLGRFVSNTRDERGNVWDSALVDAFGDSWQGVGKFFNGVTYSMADNLMAMATASGITGITGADMASKTAERIIQTVMSSEATASEMLEQLKSGKDPAEAAVMALGGGLIEAITEKYSIEALLQPNVREMIGDPVQILKYLGKNTLAEGSEEVASDALNILLDAVVSVAAGHENEIEQEIRELAASSRISEGEAARQVFENRMSQMGISFLGGALSGFVMSGSRAAANVVTQAREGSTISSETNTRSGKTGGERLVEAALGMGENTQSRALAEEIQESGKKPSNYQLGRLAQNIVQDSTEAIGNVARETVQQQAETALEKEGVTGTEAKAAAEAISKAAVEGIDALDRSERAAISGSDGAMKVLQDFVSNPDTNQKLYTQTMKATQEQRAIRQEVAEMASGEAKETYSAAAKDVADSVKNAQVATEDEIRAATGRRTGDAGEIVVDHQLGKLVRIQGDNAIVSINGEERTVSLASVKATGTTAGAVLSFAQYHKGVMSEDYANKVLEGISKNKKTNAARYLDDAMKIRLAAFSLDAQPKTVIDSKTAEELYQAARQEFEAKDAERIRASQQTVRPGEGSATFNGQEYGTAGFTEALRSLPKQTRNQAGALAEIATRAGLRINFIHDNVNSNVYGWEDAATGEITINLAGENTDGTRHHLLVTASHEMTHWLEQNSREGYAQLRSFIVGRLRNSGVNVQQLLTETIDNYNMQMGEKAGENGLDLSGAMAEVVANGCDQLLSSEKVATELSKVNPTLYGKVKAFVKDFVTRIRAAVAGMNQSTTRESAALLKDVDEIARIWLGAREEALGRTQADSKNEKAGKQFSFRNENNEIVSITDQEISTNRDTVHDMAPVIEITETEYNKLLDGGNIIENGYEYFTNQGGKAYNQIIGTVELAKSGLRHIVGRGNAAMIKAMTIPAIKSVIENGEIVHIDNKNTYKPVDSVVIAAKVKMPKGNYYVGVLVSQDNGGTRGQKNRYSFHAALVIKENAAEMDPKESSSNELPKGNSSVPVYKILQNIAGRNGKSGQTAQSATADENILKSAGEITAEPLSYSLAGPKARSGFASYTEEAARMESEGVSEKAITERTGCVKGFGGRWWKVLDRDGMHFDTKGIVDRENGSTYSLEDVYDAAELYQAYPQLRKATVTFKEMPNNIWGSASGGMNQKISINKNLLNYEGSTSIIESTLQHEIQHAIQNIEGSNSGASVAYWKDMQDIARARMHANSQYLESIYKNYGIDAEKELAFGIEFNEDGTLDEEWLFPEELEKVKKISSEDLERIRKIDEDTDKWSKILKGDRSPQNLYLETVGEIEARAAGERTGKQQWDPIYYGKNAVTTEEYTGGRSYSVARMSPELQSALKEYQAAQKESNEARKAYNELKNGQEYQELYDRILGLDSKSPEFEKAVEEYAKWEQESGLSDLKKKTEAAAERLEKASKEYNRAYNREEVEKERKAIEKSGLTEPEYRRKQAVKEYGYTTDFREAGYMLPNGKLLNFTGEKGAHYGHRGQDHRNISTIYAGDEIQGAKAMLTFMADGNIRVMAETPGIDINSNTEPTSEQYSAIRRMAERFAKEEYFGIDFTDERGNTVDTIEYDGRVNPTKIVNDIKAFYRTGSAPQQSIVSQFHYSIQQKNEQKNTEGRNLRPMVDDIDNMGDRQAVPSDNTMINGIIQSVNTDEAYKAAVERGDLKAATNMLMDKLKDAEGVIPFIAPHWDAGKDRETARLIKAGATEAIAKAAADMAPFVPDNAVLIPMPGHTGIVTDNSGTMILANAISELTDRPVVNAIEGVERESRQEAKARGEQGVSQKELGLHQVAEIPEGTFPIFIDNVVGKGVTADAARAALGGGITLAYTKTIRSPGIVGLKNAIITYDKNGNLIPLSQRFDVSKRNVRYSLQAREETAFSLQQANIDVNRWMLGLNEQNLNTVQERNLLRQYKDLRMALEVTRMAREEREKALRKLEAKENKTAYDREQIRKMQNLLTNSENKMQKLEDDMLRVTSSEGYAGMMYAQQRLMNELVTGRTADEVRQTTEAINKELETVTKEMNARAERLKKLTEAEGVATARTYFANAGLKKIAAKVKADLTSNMANKDIESRLALAALKMSGGESATEDIEDLAGLLMERRKAEYESYILSELRGRTITLSESQMKELKGQNRTLREVQKELSGSGIRIRSGKGDTLDMIWGELCDTIPSLDKDINDKDMLDNLLQVVRSELQMIRGGSLQDSMPQFYEVIGEALFELVGKTEKIDAQAKEMIKFIREISGEARETAKAIEDLQSAVERMKVKGAKARGAASVLDRNVGKAIDYFNALTEQSEAAIWRRERVKLIEQMKSDQTEALLKEQDKWKKRIERDKNARNLIADNNRTRRQISANVKRARRLLAAETDQKNIPEHMKGLAREMLRLVVKNDLNGKRKLSDITKQDLIETWRLLTEWEKQDGAFDLRDLQAISDPEVQTVVAEALADIEDGIRFYNASGAGLDMITNLNGLKNALGRILEGVTTVSEIISAERSLIFREKRVLVEDAAADMVRDMAKSNFKGERTGKLGKAVTTFRKAVVSGNMTPVYFIKNLKNAAMTQQWQEMESGENRNGLEMQKAKDYLERIAASNGYSTWDVDTKRDVILGGAKVKMTLENMMALYATWKREQHMGPEMSSHLEKGGVYIDESNLDEGLYGRRRIEQRAHRVTAEDMARIENMLTADQKAYVDDLVQYLSKDMSDLGNEASMRMYGIKKYKEDYYFPMKVWDGVKAARSDRGISGTDENRIAHRSWSKRRTNMARNALVIGNFTDTAVQHIVEMINYNTMAPAIENLNKVLNFQIREGEGDTETRRNVRTLFSENYGKEALHYLETFMKDLNGGAVQDQRKSLREQMLSIFKKNAVAGSLSVSFQQPLSYIRAAMMIDPKYLAMGLNPATWKGSHAEMVKYSGVAAIKDMGRFDMNFGQSAREYIRPEKAQSRVKAAANWAIDKTTILPELMDRMTWTRMWNAVKYEQHAKDPGADMKSEAFLRKCAERFNDVMRKTQVYDSVLVKSSNMRSQNYGMKVITSFMAEPTLSLNVLADAVRNAGEKGGKLTLAKAAATFLLSAVAQAAVKGGMSMGRTPDEKKTKAENFINKFAYNLINEANPLSLIPGYGDMVELLKKGELSDDAMSVVGKIKSGVTTIQKALKGEGKGWYRDLEDSAGQIAQLFTNIPAKNIMRDMRAIYSWWMDPNAYANRETSPAVLKYQTIDNLASADNLTGLINQYMEEAGYETSNAAYYQRIYEAQKAGRRQEAQEMTEYLLKGKGVKEDTLRNKITSLTKEDESLTEAEKAKGLIENGTASADDYIIQGVKGGSITREDAIKLLKEQSPDKDENSVWWRVDRAMYQKETGNEIGGNGYYYRLTDAINANKAEEIQTAVSSLLAHGIDKDKIKKKLSDWKSAYLEADTGGKRKIRDALQKAYRALGLTAADADKTINAWKPAKSKKN